MRAQFREAFDATKPFIIQRPMKLEGKALKVGDTFPRERVPLRRLRQLFDQRALSYPWETGRDRARPVNPARPIIRKGVASAMPPIIPDDWRSLSWPKLRSLAAKFANVGLHGRMEVEDAVEAEVARRAREAARGPA